ncbi:MAG: zinc-binding domain-containing protein, partial [Candidatus Thiodiazotropha taylori]|nr:zinc-binding domain-containing protein [Candidatus Thiodiazotropha taylori]MCW4285677.1 zinc-binding domain-containing protein [Candidatus Thiodiazotropha taylori]
MNERLFGNNNISVRKTPLFFANFNTSSIKTIRDIWDSDNKTFLQDNIIQNRLIDKANWRQQYNKIKTCVPKDWIEILKTCNAQASKTYTFTVSSDLELYYKEKYIEPNKIKLKQIQHFLLDKTYKPKCQAKWEGIFNEHFEWQSIWESSIELPCSNKEKQFQWKIINNAIFTEHKLQLMNLSNGICHFCNEEIEDIKHLFVTCRSSQTVAQGLRHSINRILNSQGFPDIVLEGYHVVLGFKHVNKTVRIFVNFILHIFKWELWKIRNNMKHEHYRYSATDIFSVI